MTTLVEITQSDLDNETQRYSILDIPDFVDQADAEARVYWEQYNPGVPASTWECDAFRHSYISGRVEMEYGNAIATMCQQPL